MDNVFVERLWRTVKYEHLYVMGYETVPDLERGLKEFFRYYNRERMHQSLGYETPESVYRAKRCPASSRSAANDPCLGEGRSRPTETRQPVGGNSTVEC